MRARAFALGLGGNLGDVLLSFRRSVRRLRAEPGISDLRLSGVYRTPPWGEVEGGDFLNAAVSGKWSGSDMELLELCREMEKEAGSPLRKEGGARTLDVDVLFLEDGVSRPELRLPHPRLALRAFVLVPLSEVWEAAVPGSGSSPEELLERLEDPSSIIFAGTMEEDRQGALDG